MNAATKRIRYDRRTTQHTVWFEPKTGTYEIIDVFGKQYTSGNAIAACALLWPEQPSAHLVEVMSLRETPFLEVSADDPREAVL